MNAIQMNWVPTTFLLSSAVFLVPFGRLSDILGRKKFMILGDFILAVSFILLIFAPDANWFLAFRIVQGLASAMVFGTSMAILMSVFPLSSRGKVLGFNVAAV